MRTFIVILVSIVFLPSVASARAHRVTQIPFGERFDCTSCHVRPSGGDILTGFGADARGSQTGEGTVDEQDTNWGPLAALDSDRDGFTNGEELNDVDGTWVIGDANPGGGAITNPGDPDSHPPASCGDGRVTPPEECDGNNLGIFTCPLLGDGEGTLSCNVDCSFNTTQCSEADDFNNATVTDAGVDDVGVAEAPTDESAGCATVGPSPSVWVLLFGLVLAIRRFKIKQTGTRSAFAAHGEFL